MSLASQIFLLFYAVLYGVIFTISDRWRPFFMDHSSEQGWKRLVLGLLFFGVLPVGYFLLALPCLLAVTNSSTLHLALAVYAVAPLIAFYFLWIWIVLWKRDVFYSEREQKIDPLKTSLEWVGSTPVSRVGIVVQLVLFLIGPLCGLVVVWGFFQGGSMEEDNGFDLEGLTVTQATELVLLRSRIGALGASENEQRRILQEARSGLEDLLNGPHVASVLRTLSVLARQASEKITADIVPAEEEDQLDLIVQETAESLIRTLDDLHHQYQYLAQNIDAGDDDTTLDFIRERHGEFRRRIVDLVHRRVAAEWLLNHKELREALWDFELALVRAEKDLGRTGWVRDSRFASDTNDFLSAIYGVDQRSPSRDPPRLGHAE